jgi:hypothetical protein
MAQGTIRLDKKPEALPSVESLKAKLNELMTKARAFMANHKFLKPKERAQRLKEIDAAFLQISRDIEKFKSQPITSPAVKFSFESFRASYNSFIPRWRKFQASLLGD